MSLELACADWTLTILPDLGGLIAALRCNGTDVLRPAAPGATDPLTMGCFPLIPYANRIANGCFSFDGRDYRLPRNAPGQAHPLHGLGWQRPWDVTHSTARSATLACSHHGDEHWPWRYSAEQAFVLDESGLRVTLSITNADAVPMPCGLGFHPYFPAKSGTTVRFDADSVWLAGDDLLPRTIAAADHFGDWSMGAAVCRTSLIDNSYAGWSGQARIASANGDVWQVFGEGTPFLHLYMPPNADFFCAEPTSDMPDAFNRSGPTIVLAPNQSHAIAMTIASVG